jgi:hypothetical protein
MGSAEITLNTIMAEHESSTIWIIDSIATYMATYPMYILLLLLDYYI